MAKNNKYARTRQNLRAGLSIVLGIATMTMGMDLATRNIREYEKTPTIKRHYELQTECYDLESGKRSLALLTENFPKDGGTRIHLDEALINIDEDIASREAEKKQIEESPIYTGYQEEADKSFRRTLYSGAGAGAVTAIGLLFPFGRVFRRKKN